MPGLLINIVNDNWVAEVANTDISYTFAGGNLAMQSQNVQNLSLAMEMSEENGITVTSFFEDMGVENDVMVEQLFGDTDMILYVGRVIYGTVGDESLIDVLVEAGEALAACF